MSCSPGSKFQYLTPVCKKGTNDPFALAFPGLQEEPPRPSVGLSFLEAPHLPLHKMSKAPSVHSHALPTCPLPSASHLPISLSAAYSLLPITERSYGWKRPFFGNYFPQAQKLLQGLLVILPLPTGYRGRWLATPHSTLSPRPQGSGKAHDRLVQARMDRFPAR